MSKPPELKPCPFCGHRPMVQQTQESTPTTRYRVGCAQLDCQCIPTTFWQLSPEVVAELWNTRRQRAKNRKRKGTK